MSFFFLEDIEPEKNKREKKKSRKKSKTKYLIDVPINLCFCGYTRKQMCSSFLLRLWWEWPETQTIFIASSSFSGAYAYVYERVMSSIIFFWKPCEEEPWKRRNTQTNPLLVYVARTQNIFHRKNYNLKNRWSKCFNHLPQRLPWRLGRVLLPRWSQRSSTYKLLDANAIWWWWWQGLWRGE